MRSTLDESMPRPRGGGFGRVPVVGARICSCTIAAAMVLGACSPDESSDRVTPSATPSSAASFSPPAPSFSPNGPPRVPPGFRQVVVGSVGISAPRTWTPCDRHGEGIAGLEGPSIGFRVPEWPADAVEPLLFQVDPPPGGKLFDARNRDARLIDAILPETEGTIGEIDVPNAIQTAALEEAGKLRGRRFTVFNAWAMGADGTRVRLAWFGGRRLWNEIEPSYRDVAASIEFGVEDAPTKLEDCAGL